MKRSKPTIASKTRFGSKETNTENSPLIWIAIGSLVVLVFLMMCYSCAPENSDGFTNSIGLGFQNLVGKLKGGSAIKDYDIIYFYSPSCPWCKKMTQVLQNESALDSMTLIDVTKPEGQKLAQEMGAADKGVPAFISKTYKTGTVGYRDSVDELLKSLDKKGPPSSGPVVPPSDSLGTFQNLQIVVFVSPSCGWCNKMKGELQDSGVIDVVELVDVSTDEGQQMAKEVLKEFRGVPACYSKVTGKTSVGYKSVGELVEALS